MRTSLIPSMLKVIANNINAGNPKSRLFELGRIYTDGNEPDMLCVGLYGKDESFYTLKGIMEELVARFKINVEFERYGESPFHPGRSAECDFARFGEISPIVLQDYDMDCERVYIAEIDLGKLFAQIADKTVYEPIPKYPASVRDLSLVCDNDTQSGEIVKTIGQSGGKLLESVEFFDVYQLEQGKSLSYKLTFRKQDGTLTDEEVNKAISKVLKALEQKNIKLRG